jgi:hypothetical protein
MTIHGMCGEMLASGAPRRTSHARRAMSHDSSRAHPPPSNAAAINPRAAHRLKLSPGGLRDLRWLWFLGMHCAACCSCHCRLQGELRSGPLRPHYADAELCNSRSGLLRLPMMGEELLNLFPRLILLRAEIFPCCAGWMAGQRSRSSRCTIERS